LEDSEREKRKLENEITIITGSIGMITKYNKFSPEQNDKKNFINYWRDDFLCEILNIL
jgi:hypothetical protein